MSVLNEILEAAKTFPLARISVGFYGAQVDQRTWDRLMQSELECQPLADETKELRALVVAYGDGKLMLCSPQVSFGTLREIC
jgi:hypothetical protein